jgi:hypothetical protein
VRINDHIHLGPETNVAIGAGNGSHWLELGGAGGASAGVFCRDVTTALRISEAFAELAVRMSLASLDSLPDSVSPALSESCEVEDPIGRALGIGR